MQSLKNILKTVKPLYNVKEFVGCEEQEVAYMQELFGTLPSLLKEFYATAAATEQFHKIQDCWILPKDLKKYKTLHHNDYFLLLNENQGVCCAGIRKKDLQMENPPVYVGDWRNDWKLCASTFTEFLFGFLLYESVFSMDFDAEEFVCLTDQEAEYLKNNFQKYPCCIQNWMDTESIRFLHCAESDVVVLMDCGEYQMLYGAATERDFETLQATLQGIGEPM